MKTTPSETGLNRLLIRPLLLHECKDIYHTLMTHALINRFNPMEKRKLT